MKKIYISIALLCMLPLCAMDKEMRKKRRSQARQLTTACAKGDIDRVQKILEAGAPVHGLGISWTPLHLAAMQGHAAIAQCLIEHKAAIDAMAWNRMPLHLAAEYNKMEIATLLLNSKADVNQANDYGRPPLFYVQNSSTFVELLLHHKADTTDARWYLFAGYREPLGYFVRRWDLDERVRTEKLLELHAEAQEQEQYGNPSAPKTAAGDQKSST